MHFDLESLIKATGYVGIAAVVFAESGLLIGLLLPGDSLLFTAGFLASQGYLNIAILVIVAFVAAIIGDSVGYSIGLRFGPKVFKRKNSLFFNKEHVERSQRFYKKHGGKAIILARFTPIVRTFAPLLAGVGKMHYRTFIVYNVVGALLWAVALPILGYYLGKSIPNVDSYLLPIIAGIIIFSLIPSFIHLAKDAETRKKLISASKHQLRLAFGSKRKK